MSSGDCLERMAAFAPSVHLYRASARKSSVWAVRGVLAAPLAECGRTAVAVAVSLAESVLSAALVRCGESAVAVEAGAVVGASTCRFPAFPGGGDGDACVILDEFESFFLS